MRDPEAVRCWGKRHGYGAGGGGDSASLNLLPELGAYAPSSALVLRTDPPDFFRSIFCHTTPKGYSMSSSRSTKHVEKSKLNKSHALSAWLMEEVNQYPRSNPLNGNMLEEVTET